MPGGGFVSTSTDITERKRTEARMLHLAQHDPLTGLPNRLLFQDRLRQAMARCRRDRSLLAVVLVDLDKFKEVNDAFGHRVGDDVLKQVGERMRAALRESDTVARIGGDEFALVLSDLPDAEAAALIADKISSQLDRPFGLAAARLATARQPRDRAVPDRRPEPGGAPAECRSGDVPGQGRGRRLPALRHRDQARFRPAAEPQARSRARHPARSAQPRVSAAAGSPARAGRRDRGPAALAAPGLRSDRPRDPDQARGGERPDRRDRRVGDDGGLPGGRRLAEPRAAGPGRGQRLGQPAQAAGSGDPGRAHPRRTAACRPGASSWS